MKSFVLLSVFLAASMACAAQFAFGVKAGVNYNHTMIKNFDPLKDLVNDNMAVHVGVFAQLSLSEKFLFIPELQYVQRGYTLQNSSINDTRINFNYVEVPLLLAYRPVNILQIEAGPTFAGKISTVASVDDVRNRLGEYDDDRFEIGISAGARVNISRFSVMLHYHYDFTSFEEYELRNEFNEPLGKAALRHSGLQLSCAYRIFGD